MNRLKINKWDIRGALLIEVLLTISILSVGLVFIIQSMMMSLRATAYTESYSTAVFLAEEKLYDLIQVGDIADSMSEFGTFDSPFDVYKYHLTTDNIKRDDEKGPLNELRLNLSWKSGRKKHNIVLTTFVPNREEE